MYSKKIEEAKKVSGTNYVYVLLNDIGMIKVGITDSPYERFIAIQNASGSLIIKYYLSESISNNYEIEQYIHKHFKKYNSVAEWYRNISFDKVCNFVSDYIDRNGNKMIKPTYVVVLKENTNLIDINEYIDIFAKLITTTKILNINIASNDLISKMDELIFEYENLFYSSTNKIDKALRLARYSIALEKAIFMLLDICGAKNILDNHIYYDFFNKYYNVEKATKSNMKKNVTILC